MTDHEYEHLFGWMRGNPTWAREFAAIEQMRAALVVEDGGAYIALMQNRNALAAENDRLLELLREARQDIADWAAYADDYFQKKHDLAGTLAKYDAALGGENKDGHR